VRGFALCKQALTHFRGRSSHWLSRFSTKILRPLGHLSVIGLRYSMLSAISMRIDFTRGLRCGGSRSASRRLPIFAGAPATGCRAFPRKSFGLSVISPEASFAVPRFWSLRQRFNEMLSWFSENVRLQLVSENDRSVRVDPLHRRVAWDDRRLSLNFASVSGFACSRF
jgi:hypothetical protein